MSTSYGWEGKGRYGSFRFGWTCGCASKIVKSLENTCHTWALLRWWFTTKRRYIKCMHLFLPSSEDLFIQCSSDAHPAQTVYTLHICPKYLITQHICVKRSIAFGSSDKLNERVWLFKLYTSVHLQFVCRRPSLHHSFQMYLLSSSSSLSQERNGRFTNRQALVDSNNA